MRIKNLDWYFAWISRVGFELDGVGVYRFYLIIRLKHPSQKNLADYLWYNDETNRLNNMEFWAGSYSISQKRQFTFHRILSSSILEDYKVKEHSTLPRWRTSSHRCKEATELLKEALEKNKQIKEEAEKAPGIHFWLIADMSHVQWRVTDFLTYINLNDPSYYWIYYYEKADHIKGFVQWLREKRPSSIWTHVIECILLYKKYVHFSKRYDYRTLYGNLDVLEEFL
jgi:hypothetical protein